MDIPSLFRPSDFRPKGEHRFRSKLHSKCHVQNHSKRTSLSSLADSPDSLRGTSRPLCRWARQPAAESAGPERSQRSAGKRVLATTAPAGGTRSTPVLSQNKRKSISKRMNIWWEFGASAFFHLGAGAIIKREVLGLHLQTSRNKCIAQCPISNINNMQARDSQGTTPERAS